VTPAVHDRVSCPLRTSAWNSYFWAPSLALKSFVTGVGSGSLLLLHSQCSAKRSIANGKASRITAEEG